MMRCLCLLVMQISSVLKHYVCTILITISTFSVQVVRSIGNINTARKTKQIQSQTSMQLRVAYIL